MAPITSLSRGFHSEILRDRANNRFTDSGNDAGFRSKNRRWKCTMLNKLIVAAAVAAFAYTAVPANAAKVSAGCSGDNLSKTEAAVETMADGDGKIMAQKEMAAAQDSLLGGKMGACAAHLSKAMHAGMAK
jgi:hypothetical protein